MQKKIKVIISILALASIVFSVLILLGFNLFPFFDSESNLEESLEGFPRDQIEETTWGLPVEEQYYEDSITLEEGPQVDAFILDGGVLIKSIFSGEVKSVLDNQAISPDDTPVKIILIESENGDFWADYTFLGEPLVEEGEMVEKGKALAKLESGKIKAFADANFFLWIHDKDGQTIPLSGFLKKQKIMEELSF